MIALNADVRRPAYVNNAARTIVAATLGVAICVGCVLFGIYPYRPAGPSGWGMLIAGALLIVVAHGLIGRRLSSLSLGKRMTMLVRIIYGVVVVFLVLLLSWLLLHVGREYLTTWGA